jgi:hypothetical protein
VIDAAQRGATCYGRVLFETSIQLDGTAVSELESSPRLTINPQQSVAQSLVL